ncbi:MAG: ParB/RepB/Spo0J family partition protein [Bacteroidales bacterium]|nr:ParB/RepB/Spo0J family partition protein [Bacteroidales bacterium]
MAKKSPLGKGLGALIDNSKFETKPVEEAISTGAVAEINIKDIELNPFQPREDFNEESLKELTESIKQHGIIQPITVRKLKNGKFQLISGERRLRSSKDAGLKKIIAFVRKADDTAMLEMALIENIQREDLNAVEIAVSYQRLIDECNLTQDQLATKVSKNRTTVTNYLRLLKLPAEIQSGIQNKLITQGHAKALITIEDAKKQVSVYEKIISEKLSVRETENIILEINFPVKKNLKKTAKNNLPETYLTFKKDLSEVFNSNVNIKRNNAGRGSISISFTSDEEFNKIKKLLSRIKEK